ncbi:MAG: hypothetical protein Q6J68_06090 [Thermostichales cyanobacterium SZTDM-1c_bins_54]
MKLEDSLQQAWVSATLIFLLGGLVYGLLRAFGVSAGEVRDWAIALTSLWWLYVLVTLPWDIYFYARQLLYDTRVSQEKGIPINLESRRYVEQLYRWSLVVALGLHGVTSLAFVGLAVVGVNPLGYWSGAAALLLSLVRPGIRAYRYLIERLKTLQQEVLIPRPDAIELRQQLETLQKHLSHCLEQLDPNQTGSLAARQQADLDSFRRELANTRALIEQVRATHELEHERLRQESRQAIAQLSLDSQFLSHVREIIRFVKEA